MDYNFKRLDNYTKTYRNKQTGFTVDYLSKKQMKALFPDSDFHVAGQIGIKTKDKRIATLAANGKTQGVYKLNSTMFTAVDGYVQTEEGDFIAVKKNIWYMWLLLLLLLAALITGGILLSQNIGKTKPTGGEQTTENQQGIIDGGAGILDDISIPDKIDTAGKSIDLPGIVKIPFKSGTKQQRFVFTNPKNNPCFFQIDLIIIQDGKEETIYKSNLIPPGYSIKDFEITRELEPGEYKAVVVYNTFSFDKERNELNKGRINTKIIVE